ncbi:hypothetical protein [Cytophaga sp. FL35]|uniref:hypothetical protein n=1 Tax=Cytophaga sp. FL35 TaxID=1904456 RepID=UPI001653D93D|nr:hypothetical protein [Cytophaga sp. FL35]MBC6998847.1 hypothetical protein [Cytophaga sp. FL35]
MKQFNRKLLSVLYMLPCLITMGAVGQSREKSITEEFNVEENVIIEINTSYADLEFDTWNKDKVEIIATIEIDGVTETEFEEYVDNDFFEILGNSRKIHISNKGSKVKPVHFVQDARPLVIEIPNLPSMEDFEFDFDFSELEDVPEMPPVPNPNFDYEAFKKDGEAYMKKWQEGFEKDFGEPYQARMLEWQEKMEEKRIKAEEKRREAMEKRTQKIEQAQEQRWEAHQQRMQTQKERIEQQQRRAQNNSIRKANTFYFINEEQPKNFKVKRTLKIKMPKSAKLKMNVRHGEVKLAERTHNLDASFSHAKLMANAIDGTETVLVVSYSPIHVENWLDGTLHANYTKGVDLKDVVNLELHGKSSEIIIDRLVKRALIKNDFGPLVVNSMAHDFEEFQVSSNNGEVICNLPSSGYRFRVEGSGMEFIFPKNLKVDTASKNGKMVYSGGMGNKSSTGNIDINGNYSEIVLK